MAALKDCSILHQGYMAGLKGEDPDETFSKSEDYELGWLTGSEDREKGMKAPTYLGPCEVPLKRGDEITIPKGTIIHTTFHGERKAGRAYKVKLHDVYSGVPAYREYGFRGDIVRPVPPKVVWAGTGGYWSEADINEVLP